MQVQAAVGGSGWSQINEEGLKALGGLHFERRQQDAEEDGSAAPASVGPSSSAAAGAGETPTCTLLCRACLCSWDMRQAFVS